MNRPKLSAAKYTVYVLLMAALYILQSTPRFLTVFGVKPNLVIPLAVAVAVYEGEFVGGLFGALAGIFCDFSATSLFGFHAIIILVCCVAVGLLTIYLLRPTVVNFVILTGATLLIQGMLDYLLNYYMWGYAEVELVLTLRILPGIGYSLLLSPLVYLVIGVIFHRIEDLLEA